MRFIRLAIFATFIVFGLLPFRSAEAASCNSLKTGNWSLSSTWSCNHSPNSSDNVTIQAAHTITLDRNVTINNLTIHGTTGTQLVLNANRTLVLNGTLSSDVGGPGKFAIGGAGLLRFEGGSRALFNSSWSGAASGWNLEIALNVPATGTASSPIKAGTIKISGGTFETTSDVRPDNGSAQTGTLEIASGATLILEGNLSRNPALGTQCEAVTVYGTLIHAGSTISALNITVKNGGVYRSTSAAGKTVNGTWTYNTGSTLEYGGDAAQTTGGELPAGVQNLTIDNANGVTLDKATTVNGVLALNSGDLNTGGFVLTQEGDLSGQGEVIGSVRRTNLATGTTYPFGSAYTTLRFDSGTVPTELVVNLTKTAPDGFYVASPAVGRQYQITKTGGAFSATLRLHYTDSELSGNDEAHLDLWSAEPGIDFYTHYAASDRSLNYSPNNHWVEKSGITRFSTFAISSNVPAWPTPAELISFRAKYQNKHVVVAWETGAEFNIVGFNVWRKDGKNAWQRVTTDLVPAQDPGGIAAHQYSWSEAVKKSRTYRYKLEIVSANGQRQWSDARRVRVP